MNKVFLYTTSCILTILFCACNNKIIIQRKDSKLPVIVRMNNKYKSVNGILFPFNLSIVNSNLVIKKFIEIEYEYGFRKNCYGLELYENNKKISNNKLKIIKGRDVLEYQIYTRHAFDTTKLIHTQLQPYLEKMIELNQDTLHIGTVTEFKKSYPEIFKMLTENDTISIDFYERKNKYFSNKQAIPANW